MQEELYRSKLSAWYFLIPFILVPFVFILYFLMAVPEEWSLTVPLASSLIILSIWFIVLLCFYVKIRYILRENSLYVKGISTELDIPYSSIKEIKEEYSSFEFFWAHTVLSKDQIRIDFVDMHGRRWFREVLKKGEVIREEGLFISPVRKEEFLAKLRARYAV